MSKTYYAPGDHNVIDDLHGRKLKRSQCRLRWDGMLVPWWDYEERHPQDFLRPRPEIQRVQDARPEQADRFEPAPVTPEDL